ncbi:MAG: UbiA family prenyltransferase [Coriobacteriia bacterium]|nr:UbiA family prenyltransferase [Coriobacteriia bacterium]
MTSEAASYQRLSPKAALQLMSAHTWVAAIAPVIVGGTLTIGLRDYTPLDLLTHNWLALLIGVLMLFTAVLAQSAVNTLNDYYDFKSGTDTEENCVDTTDAAIIYHKLNPKTARNYAFALIAAAAIIGCIIAVLTSPLILLFGLVGAATLILYSGSKKSISYLPIGEIVSGFVMGGIITVATYFAMTGHISWAAVLGSLPPIITIALIMQVNNTSDIERDREAGRRTLPILIGAKRSAPMIATLQVLVLLFCALYCLFVAPLGIAIIVLAAILSVKRIRLLWSGPYSAENRPAVMKAVVAQAILVNLAFVVAILLGAHFV